MVAVVFVISALSFGTLGAISVFLKPLSEEFGWSRAETSLGYTAISLSSAVFGILWGYIADRNGTRWFGVIAAIVMAASLFMLSQQTTIVEFYAYYFLFGAFGTSMATSPLYANVGFWFRHNAGLALGITAAGGAFGQAIVPYMASLGITEMGWQETYFAMGWCYLVIALPIAFLIRESPARERARVSSDPGINDFPLSEVEVLIWISVAVIFCCNCMAVPIVHLVPMLNDAGESLEYAAGILMLLMLSGVFGRILGGKLGDLIGALPAYMFMSFGQTISVFWFPHVEGEFALYLLAIFFGFTYSGVMSSILVCTRMMVSAKFAGRAMSITSFFGWGGMGLGGFFGGYFFDLSGNYVWSYGFASAMGVINLIVLSLFYLRINSKTAMVPVPGTQLSKAAL
jgi:MFS family permease